MLCMLETTSLTDFSSLRALFRLAKGLSNKLLHCSPFSACAGTGSFGIALQAAKRIASTRKPQIFIMF